MSFSSKPFLTRSSAQSIHSNRCTPSLVAASRTILLVAFSAVLPSPVFEEDHPEGRRARTQGRALEHCHRHKLPIPAISPGNDPPINEPHAVWLDVSFSDFAFGRHGEPLKDLLLADPWGCGDSQRWGF
jgi:hypothetical protein